MLAVVSHDAGGAEVLSSYLRREKLDARFVLAGPALKIFNRKLGAVDSGSLKETIQACDWVLCGTSWQSDLEFNAVVEAGKAGRRCVAFLDHWANYTDRFTRGPLTCLPDEIWVGDRDAQRIAKSAFPDTPIELVDNPYFKDLREELGGLTPTTAKNPRSVRFLYTAEPIAEHAEIQRGHSASWGYNEEDALRFFLGNVRNIAEQVGSIVIRPHPAEKPDKYAWAARDYDLPIEFGGKRPLLHEVVDADVVVGCESMALVVGLLAGKSVISSIPPGGRPIALPQKEIISLAAMLQARGGPIKIQD